MDFGFLPHRAYTVNGEDYALSVQETIINSSYASFSMIRHTNDCNLTIKISRFAASFQGIS